MLVYVKTMNLLIYCRHLMTIATTGPNNMFNNSLMTSKVVRVVPIGGMTKVMNYEGRGGKLS
jgi:hypothetical protein